MTQPSVGVVSRDVPPTTARLPWILRQRTSPSRVDSSAFVFLPYRRMPNVPTSWLAWASMLKSRIPRSKPVVEGGVMRPPPTTNGSREGPPPESAENATALETERAPGMLLRLLQPSCRTLLASFAVD